MMMFVMISVMAHELVMTQLLVMARIVAMAALQRECAAMLEVLRSGPPARPGLAY